MDTLEFIKAIAPYVTALVAVLVAAFTAWLSHRNWIKQFKIQRSESILKEQIRLLQEVPKTLNDAVRLVAHTVWALACSDAFARAKIPEFANPLMKDCTEYQAKLTDLLAELEVPEVSVRLYFGEEAGKYWYMPKPFDGVGRAVCSSYCRGYIFSGATAEEYGFGLS